MSDAQALAVAPALDRIDASTPLASPAVDQAVATTPCIAVVGLGYVGLPTALALHQAGSPVIGIDVSERRLQAIRSHDVDLPPSDVVRLREALGGARLRLSSIPAAIVAADAVIICVPTPVDEQRRPDPTRAARRLRDAPSSTPARARRSS